MSFFYKIKSIKDQVNALLQSKTVTPDGVKQNIKPDKDYDGLSKVIVDPIPSSFKPQYSEDNPRFFSKYKKVV